MKPRPPKLLTLSHLHTTLVKEGLLTVVPVKVDGSSISLTDRQLAAFGRAARKAGREMRQLLNPTRQ